METKIRGAVIGYGMGKHHANQMTEAGIDFAALCEPDPVRREQAKLDYPHIRTYSEVKDLLADPDIDLVAVVTPHNTHAELAIKVMESGKNCIVDKPMCIRADDAAALVDKARNTGVMLSVYHNRRWDDWYLTTKRLIEQGVLGDVFSVEMNFSNYGHPGNTWRSYKDVSGGIFYDWGAHYMDWMLGIVPGKMKSIRGYVQKRLWDDVTNEDQLDCMIEFESGAIVHSQTSQIDRAGKTAVRILGTKGAIETDRGVKMGDYLTLYTDLDGIHVETKVPFLPSSWISYYHNIVDHLTNGAELAVKPEQVLRVISVLETAGKSAVEGRELSVPYER